MIPLDEPALAARTAQVLDWPVVLEALSAHARTAPGARACLAGPLCRDAEEARACHDAIEEVARYEDEGATLPVAGVSDIGPLLTRAARGEVLDPAELRDAGRTLGTLRLLADRLQGAEELPVLDGLAQRIQLDPGVVDELEGAFDPTGRLSAAAWPELGELRTRIADLHASIRRTLEDMLRSEAFEDLLQDRFVTQRGDRYVLPIKAHARRWDLGIVHGTSGSGATVFVEPSEVVALNNRMRLAEGELQAAERRILAALSRSLGLLQGPVHEALQAALAIDLACARLGLARALGATRPLVRHEGVVDLREARHPVLALRGVEVVPNALRLAAERPALVLTGPNTGGKTVALKTVGLCALLVRAGCFVPALAGSRVDWFDEVVADIGDLQTVQGDLSSFSGHLVVLRAMLDRARPGSLFLLDEICAGTDPAQGGALARAVLEALVERGPRLVATTHYAQLKALATADPRFALAAMEYAEGRPTYRVMQDAIGESHALDTALRMGLPPDLVDRARGLMGLSERALADALAALDAERERADQAVRAAEGQAAALAARARELEAREARLAQRQEALDRREAGRFAERLRKAEKAIAAVVTELQRSPDHERVRAARATVGALRGLLPDPSEVAREPAAVQPGDRVRVRGQAGEVISVGEGSAQVRVGALTVKARLDDLERLAPSPRATPAAPAPPPAPKREPTPLDQAVRHPGNTLDLRGQRVDEAFEQAEAFFDAALLRDQPVVFLLHGHGTGALKEGLRRWLRTSPYVRGSAPAHAEQGGDAFTVVALRRT